MLKTNFVVDPAMKQNMSKWLDSPALQAAYLLPFWININLMGAMVDGLGDQLKNHPQAREYLQPNGRKRKNLLEVYHRANRMSASISEYGNSVLLCLMFIEKEGGPPLFELQVLFDNGFHGRFSSMKPPVPPT